MAPHHPFKKGGATYGHAPFRILLHFEARIERKTNIPRYVNKLLGFVFGVYPRIHTYPYQSAPPKILLDVMGTFAA